MKALETIFNNINNGKVYGNMFTKCKYPFFNINLCLGNNPKYIYWCNFGSSHNNNNLRDLQWIIETIFKTTPEKFISEYECR